MVWKKLFYWEWRLLLVAAVLACSVPFGACRLVLVTAPTWATQFLAACHRLCGRCASRKAGLYLIKHAQHTHGIFVGILPASTALTALT